MKRRLFGLFGVLGDLMSGWSVLVPGEIALPRLAVRLTWRRGL
jgi:hypothetical protein